MDTVTLVIAIAGICLAIYFNVCNGRNDAANTIAISLATRALSPGKAVILASIFCLIGPFVFSTAVASTIGKGLVVTEILTPILLLIALIGSIFWVSFCSHKGLPVSSSHAMVGGLIGAGLAAGGINAVLGPPSEMFFGMLFYLGCGTAIGGVLGLVISLIAKAPVKKGLGYGAMTGAVFAIPIAMIAFGFVFSGILAILLFICISPMLGFLISFCITMILTKISSKISKNPTALNKWFQRLQVAGSAFQALSLGGNDAQHAMGFIMAIMMSVGWIGANDPLPFWVIMISALAISIGLLSGGWKVIRNLGSGITKILPNQGFSASLAAGSVLSAIVAAGVPVSSTHLTTGTIMGTGVTKGFGAVNWKTVRSMVLAWVITIPCAAIVSFVLYLIIKLIFGL
ncbi:MAG TPA: inorganic phosphate transporter [Methanocorpusculum sp.]|nr:inorganic phosphate transporter [Methanocorpusculum sp.]